ncbi:MAG: UTP--glucose-1-phosphate uridylyltransferase GalU [Gammaproteobacteria bacterium]|nr:UTP--glucose-1-phosphate uridylyltransferase GalU [Gammaproteobacteria bacterium]
MKPIRKAVLPVAGLGTRFLPATKVSPKEMLPIVDKPLVQYAAEEAVAAGAEILVFITGRTKRPIADHFDRAYELETELEARGKQEMLDLVRNVVPEHVTCSFIRQPHALGLGHAVLCAEPVVGDEPFFVLLADDLINTSGSNCLQQMSEVYRQTGCSVLGVQQIKSEDTRKYGVIEPVGELVDGKVEVSGLVEKPEPQAAPSKLGIVGRYILTPGIFESLRNTPRGVGDEIQLTDAIQQLLGKEKAWACEFEGKRYDCGSKLGYLEATVELALQHPDLKGEFAAYLREFSRTL